MNSQLINENKIITEYSIWMLFSLSGNAVYRLRELELAQFGLTVEQSTILYLISRRGSITLKTIEILTSRQHHSISTLINRMVKMRLVTKTKNTESSKFEILLTAHGKDMYKNVTTRSMEMVFSIFSTKDKERLYTYLNTLLETAQKLLGVIHPFLQYGDADNNGKKNLKEYDKDRHTTGFELWIVFNRTRNSIYRLRELELAQFDLSVEQSAILHFLISQGGSINAKTIEYLTSRQHHSIWALINRMIKMSLVTKTKNPESNKFDILITEHGKDIYKNVTIRSMEMVFSIFSTKDKERLYTYLNTLLETAQKLLGVIHPFLQNGDPDKNGKKNLNEYDIDRHTTGFELWIIFNRTRNSIYRLRELELAQFDLSVEQSAILHFLISQGGSINAKTIEYLTSRQHHSIWALINRMIKMSLVTKTKNPESNKFEILITEHGKEMYKKVPIRSIEMVYSLFSAKEKDRLSVYFSTLLEKSWDLLGLSFATLSLLQQARASSYEDRSVRPPVV